MHDRTQSPPRKKGQQIIINWKLAGANLRSQQLLGSKNASRKRGDIRVCNNHLRGKLNVEDRPDSVCDSLCLTLGPETEVVVIIACAHSR